MLTPPSPHFPEVPRTDDLPGNDPEREPRKEPEPDVGEPQRSLWPMRFNGLYSPAGSRAAPQLAALLRSPCSVRRPLP